MAYISVNDAVERTGKGQTTIYRFCRKFEHTRHVKREDKKFLIDEEFLSKHLIEPEAEQTENGKQEEPKQELIDIFIEELLNEKRYYRLLLDRKDEQLVRKDGIISSLQDRQKELHYLLNHQTQLLESARKPEPESLSQDNSGAVVEESKKEEAKPGNMMYQAQIVYAVLAAVALMLVLAIIFVDEIKAL